MVLARVNAQEGYAAIVDNTGICAIVKFSDSGLTTLKSTPYSLSKKTEYIFEFILDDTLLTFNVKDENGETLIKSISCNDDSFNSGNIGLMGGEYRNDSQQPVYFDYIKIKSFK